MCAHINKNAEHGENGMRYSRPGAVCEPRYRPSSPRVPALPSGSLPLP